MSVQQMGAKKIREFKRKTGLDLDMVWNRSGGGQVFEARTVDDIHYLVNRESGEYERQTYGYHMTSCKNFYCLICKEHLLREEQESHMKENHE